MVAYPKIIFIIDDSVEDSALYRKFLERDSRYTYDIYEFDYGLEGLRYCEHKTPELILLDYQLPDIDGLEFINQLQRQPWNRQIPVILMTGQGDETIAVKALKNGAQDYLVKKQITRDSLQRVVHGTLERIQLIKKLEQQQKQQRLVAEIALRIRQFLKLADILTTSVQEIRQLLNADRVLIYQFAPEMSGKIVAESVLPAYTATLEIEIEDSYFRENKGREYCQGKIWAVANIYQAGLSNCHLQLLEQFQVQANLVVPILLENLEIEKAISVLLSPSPGLWGLLVVHQCSEVRQWETFEIELLSQLTVQLAIAIQQAELYHNLQILNSELETKVDKRTTELQQSERRFRAIFNNTFQFTGLLTVDGLLLEVNQTALNFGGIMLENVINRPLWETHWWTISTQTQQELVQATMRASQGEFVRYEVDILGMNNQVTTIDFSLRPLRDDTGQVVLLISEGRDISEKKQAEERIKHSLKEKEVLLQEIHHRVKNNLGIVSSLLQMQCRRTQDTQATEILRDSQNRIASIALVHEKLYRSTDLANIDFAQYIPNLTTHLFDSYHVSSNYIKLNIQVDDVSLDIETAIPCGLIINELVSNALKHAFPDNGTGEIHLSLNQQNKHDFILIIRDNGIGLPVDFDSKKLKTLGITLVQGLVKQLRGSIEISSQQGTEFKIKFTKSRA